jgi:glycosyltransferase involved in cell wall biosynthesis
MDKILYIKTNNFSFSLLDQKIIEKKFRVVTFLFQQKKSKLFLIPRFIALFFFILFNSFRAKAMITWFADYHSALMVFMGRLLRTKVVIFAGGQEAICYPELKKGAYYKKFRSKFVKYALRNASLVIPNHKSLLYHENYYYDPKGKKDGILYYNPGIKTNMVVLPNGIDTNMFFRDESIKKNERMVLTVGTMHSMYDFINKGFDLFIELAKRNPGFEFVMIGIKEQFLPWIEESYHVSEIQNLEVILFSHHPEVLFKYYNKSKVFVQASITEGMPNTLNEAMLCECVPVGSNVNGIPDAIGDTGIIVLRRNIEELEKAVYQALNLNTGEKARNYVLDNFSLEKREKKLMNILNEQHFIK